MTLWKWHITPKLTKPEKLLRSQTTARYAQYAIWFVMVFLVMMAIVNVVGPRVHRLDAVQEALENKRKEDSERRASASKKVRVNGSTGLNSNGLVDSYGSTNSNDSINTNGSMNPNTQIDSNNKNKQTTSNPNGLINSDAPTFITKIPPWISKRIYIYTKKLPSHEVKLPLYPIMAFWSLVLLFLIFNETHYELTYLAKRLGRVSVSLLPPVYFLTLRPSPLPRTFYLQLVPFHKWLARLVFVTVVAHGLVYFFVYTSTSRLPKLTRVSNLLGIAAFFCFVAIVLTSLKPVRRRFYNTVFYPVHFVCLWGVQPLIYYHSYKGSRTYVCICVGILIGQIWYRWYLTKRGTRLPVQYVSSTMLFISIPREQLGGLFQSGSFTPGAHLRISSSGMLISRIANILPGGWKNKYKRPGPNGGYFSSLIQSTHPYTIASLPQDPVVKLCIRKTRFRIKLNKGYTITGPYSSVSVPFFEDARVGQMKRVLFVAGGTGIAFCAPLMRYLIAQGVGVKMMWAIRDMEDARVLNELGLAKAALEDKQVEIYVTRGSNKTPGSLSFLDWIEEEERLAVRDTIQGMFTAQTVDEGLEVKIDNTICDGGENRTIGRKPGYGSIGQEDDYRSVMINSRPVLNLRIKSWLYGMAVDGNRCCCLDQLVAPEETAGRWIVASGGETLVCETERWAADNGLSFYKDEFSL